MVALVAVSAAASAVAWVVALVVSFIFDCEDLLSRYFLLKF